MNNPASTIAEIMEPYAQLLRALQPRTDSISLYDSVGELRWTSDGSVGPDGHELVSASLRAAQHDAGRGEMRTTDGDEPVYLCWLRRESAAAHEPPFATVVLRQRNSADAVARPFDLVYSLLRPALECLRRELQSQEEILTLHSSLLEHGQDLAMLLSVSAAPKVATEGAVDELKQLLENVTEHLKVGLSALIIPEKGLAMIQPSKVSPLNPGLVAKAHRHLVSLAQLRNEPVIANSMAMGSGDQAVKYRILSCPVLRNDSRTMGVLALFRAQSAPEFTVHHANLAELLARRVAAVIANSYDTLSGLYNRPAFEQRVHMQLSGAAKNPWSALFIDMNRMHLINDNHGMHVGDRAIAQLGELIRGRLPPGAIAGRISGDRFAVLLPAVINDAAGFAESLRAGAEQIGGNLGEGPLQVSISVGVAAVDRRTHEFAHAFAAAETACKAANDRGRNRVEVYQETDQSIVRRFSDINFVDALRLAISDERLLLYAQLIAPMNGRGAPHFELLLRMLDENGQIQGPDRFLSAATRYQFMPDIDRGVLKEAIRQLRPLAEMLRKTPAVFAINFSGQSLKDEGFGAEAIQLLTDSGIKPECFCLELTESAAIGNLANAEVLMRKLRALGCNVALDDFGTGLSSLAYLRSLPIGMLKIDGSFVRDVLVDPKADSMVQAITQLAHSMGLVTVAEYVETEEIRARVAAIGVDYGQGFAINRPQPLVDLLQELPLYLAATEPSGAWAVKESQLASTADSGEALILRSTG